jgi:hypothetical protein
MPFKNWRGSTAFLARKFDPVRNQNIINLIDRELLNENKGKLLGRL